MNLHSAYCRKQTGAAHRNHRTGLARWRQGSPCAPPRTQRGVVLAIALILLLVLTLSAVTAMRSSSVDLKIVSNSLLREQAFQISEDTRLAAGGLVDDHTTYREWSSVTLPAGYTIQDPTGILYDNNNAEPGDYSTGTEDLTYQHPVLGEQTARLYVSRLASELAGGTAIGIGEGYTGLGRGVAGGGGYLYYDIRSLSGYSGNARALTGADFRHVIR